MICIVIKGPTFELAYQQILKAVKWADLVELRLDCFKTLEESSLKRLKSSFSIPMIFTLRDMTQGGNYQEAEMKRLGEIEKLAALKPDYLDLESHISADFVQKISKMYPEIKLIISYHDFQKTPEDLEELYRTVKMDSSFLYKIAVKANSTLDALRLLQFVKGAKGNLIVIGMGEVGQITRVVGKIFGSRLTYASIDDTEQTAPGQVNAKTLVDVYRYKEMSELTALYGLIGDPVSKSISEGTHNALMGTLGLDAVYVKMPVKKEELSEFFRMAKMLGFRGLSVTMPLKEQVLGYLDHIDGHAKEIGAVNTLIFEDGEIVGYNTDGKGALDAIEKEELVKRKKVLILGAGGAAKAIAYEVRRRGGEATMLNREGMSHMNKYIEEGYDILINCTPIELPIDASYLLSKVLVMDIKTRPKNTLLLQQAKTRGCRVVYGYRMFVEQAVGQYSLWFKDTLDSKQVSDTLETNSLEVLT